MKGQILWAMALALVVGGASAETRLWAAERSAARVAAPAKDGPVNINLASATELAKLKGVGRTIAKRIVEYREAHGEFKKPEDIRKVEGLGQRVWDENRDRIVVK